MAALVAVMLGRHGTLQLRADFGPKQGACQTREDTADDDSRSKLNGPAGRNAFAEGFGDGCGYATYRSGTRSGCSDAG